MGTVVIPRRHLLEALTVEAAAVPRSCSSCIYKLASGCGLAMADPLNHGCDDSDHGRRCDSYRLDVPLPPPPWWGRLAEEIGYLVGYAFGLALAVRDSPREAAGRFIDRLAALLFPSE